MPREKRFETAHRVHLDRKQVNAIKELSEGQSASEFMREALDYYLRHLRRGVVIQVPLSLSLIREIYPLLGTQSEVEFVQEAIARHLTHKKRLRSRRSKSHDPDLAVA